MNPAVWSAVFGTLVVAGLIGAVLALRPRPVREPVARRPSALARRVRATSSRTRLVLVVSIGGGLLLALLTGWVAAVLILPAAALGLPYLLAAPPTAATVRRLEAMEEWTRNLAGVLSSGVGLEQAVTATLRSTPDAIKPEVTALVARLRARWDTEQALRAFADDLDDVTGDLIVANLILAAQRRNRSLANALQGVAESVSEDVTSRRKVEAGRAKPRGSARLVTMFSAGVLVWLAFTGDYIAPYGTPLGQVLLVGLLTAYAAGLLWMRKMTEGKPLPRFLGPVAKAGAR
ncbi:type II secretion system F family protein [Cellulomonas sp. C5510]|uniref:type II secretion system F family protein n=1 Tax=Cellulomonas sp. C5510 TaxID=2871170 RepID=UPI001C98B1E4|nr:type II secretion system F family protein [Cellulomonas sp. C5510]QZN87027.1 type II secretion system F family protein [Cellulomonas sp. C5510]